MFFIEFAGFSAAIDAAVCDTHGYGGRAWEWVNEMPKQHDETYGSEECEQRRQKNRGEPFSGPPTPLTEEILLSSDWRFPTFREFMGLRIGTLRAEGGCR
jgi:hypothetical protein